MPYILPHQITIEKSPTYFDIPSVPERIFDMNSSVKLILVLREPVERAVSDFVQFERTHSSVRALGYKFEVGSYAALIFFLKMGNMDFFGIVVCVRSGTRALGYKFEVG